jgi:hypothetical protein
MNRKHRIPAILATSAAALALGAGPAIAGSDDCSGASCQDDNAPAQVVPAVPTPVAPAPLPTTHTRTGGAAPEHQSRRPRRRTVHRQHAVVAATQRRSVPRGAVAAGAGGTAPDGGDGALLGLVGVTTLLLGAGGAGLAFGRRSGS